jgi:hypothetical protein
MRERTPYRPTRNCPHRLCPGLHLGVIPVGLVIAAQTLFTGLPSVLYLLLAGAAVALVLRALGGKSVTEEMAQEAMERAAGVHLVVRPRWALVAAGMDAVFLLGGGSTIAVLFAHPHQSSVPSSALFGYAAVVTAVGMVWFTRFAHRQATRPVKPKRVSVPALGDTA